jgi:hypothetical protein
LEFPISVLGARPTVKLILPEEGPASLLGAPLEHNGKANAKGSKGPGKGATAPSVDHVIHFERLLVDKKDAKTFKISNTGIVPFKWRLAGADKLPKEFKASGKQGSIMFVVLPPRVCGKWQHPREQ